MRSLFLLLIREADNNAQVRLGSDDRSRACRPVFGEQRKVVIVASNDAIRDYRDIASPRAHRLHGQPGRKERGLLTIEDLENAGVTCRMSEPVPT
jgi:hypothetical protein